MRTRAACPYGRLPKMVGTRCVCPHGNLPEITEAHCARRLHLVMPLPNRRTVRLLQYDYSAPGAYFITVCARNRRHIFGEVQNGIVCLNDLGALVWREWLNSFEMRPAFTAGAFIVMPNHWHGIVHILPTETLQPEAPHIEAFGRPAKASLTSFIRGLKSSITSGAQNELGWLDGPVCQGRYWDHVIRDEEDYRRIDAYIRQNPARWRNDCFYT